MDFVDAERASFVAPSCDHDGGRRSRHAIDRLVADEVAADPEASNV
jgi:hypothetical protein